MTHTSRTPAGVPSGGQFSASAKGESTVTLDASPPDVQSVEAALAPALHMNRVQAETFVRGLIDEAAADGDETRIDEIASLAAGLGWRGTAALRRYPHTASPESNATDYLPTRAAATRTTDYASDRSHDARRNAEKKETAS